MYELIFTDFANKQFSKLDHQLKRRMYAVLERSRIRPEAHFQRLVGRPLYKLRVGDYRLIADIDKGELIILIVRLGHRSNVYD